MKKLAFITILISLSFNSYARTYGERSSDWKVIKGDNGYYLKKLDPEPKMIKIQTIGGSPEVQEVQKKEEAPEHIFVVYKAGSAGTSHIVTAYRAVVFHLKDNKFIGDLPLKYVSQQGKDVTQPTWKFSMGKLVVKDPSSGSEKTIDLR
ncbi:MAG: hypothetical protein CME60_04940 [Halobacteriovoraceae bacterium]|nr:hypothetical protein [Halobacteriovoraceae bacterium]